MPYRIDIQALRGIAVLLVVLYHARLLPLANGHFGVDIFFVISGFLISSQLYRQIEAEQFSFKQFYLRRAWRLLPAAFTVIAISLAVAPWALTHAEMTDLVHQAWGAVSFTANFVLWSQSGYFESSAELKPLLHTWSLSIEEQYYLLMPALLVFMPPKHWLKAIVLITLLSLIAYLTFLDRSPSGTFYFTSTRIWELGVGSILAFWLNRKSQVIMMKSWLPIAACCVAMLSIGFSFGGIEANRVNLLAVVAATAIVIATAPTWLNRGIIPKALASVGTISYSLYLVHWPILAILSNINVSGAGLWWPYRVFAVTLSFGMAYTLYSLVENRFRIKDKAHTKGFTPLLTTSLTVIALSFAVLYLSGGEKYTTLFQANVGLDEACRSPDFDKNPACRTSERPTILVWGDSFAMHLVPGLKETSPIGFVQATFSTCVPIDGVSFYNPPQHGLSWSEDCLVFNQSAINYATDNPNIELVILASPWMHLLNTKHQARIKNNTTQITQLTRTEMVDALIQTVSKLKAAGKKVVLVAPPPTLGFDIAKCHEQRDRKQWRIGVAGREDCRLEYSKYAERSKPLNSIIEKLNEEGVAVYSFAENLCNQEFCETKLDSVVLYQDMGHLSISGSEHYARKFSMYEKLRELAN